MWNKTGVLGEPGSRSSNLVREKENGNGTDRLPDDILCDIVSRLQIVEASQTSILSRRWRKLWTMNDSLTFSCLGTFDVSKSPHDHVADDDKQRFLKAVSQSLELHSAECKLKSFDMQCCFLNVDECHLVRWMQDLARLDVEELHLGNSCGIDNEDPLNKAFIFSFKLINGLNKLKFLDLTACYLDTGFVSQCNSLVRLHLRCMRVLSHELSGILSSCPNLTNLCMERCDLPPDVRIIGPNLKLETFQLTACSNVEKLEISDTNIVKIWIDIRSNVEISISSVPKLENLHLRTPRMQYSFDDSASRDLPPVKYIMIQTTYQILRLPAKFQVFGNIRVLYFLTRGYPYWGPLKEVDLWNFAPALVACPLLEEFYLALGGPDRPVCTTTRQVTEWPVLRHKHLQIMELSGFSNTPNEFEFAKFIVTNAEVLRILKLRPALRRFNGDCFVFRTGIKLTKADAGAVFTYIKGHFLSKHANLVMELV